MTQTMGAVYTKIKLTNAIDEALISRGLLVPNLLRTCEVDALVDTGSTYLVISPEILQKLGLRIIGQQTAKYADGREDTILITEALLIELLGAGQRLYALVTGDMVLVGQVVLEKLDLLVNYKNQRLILNPANPNYPVTYIQ